MRFWRRSLTGLLMLALTLGLLAAAALVVGNALRASLGPGGPPRAAEERVVAANVMTLTPGEVVPLVQAYGQVEAARSLTVRARTGGTVLWLAEGFRSGGVVTEGEVLVRLDPAAAQATLDLARADLAEAEAAAAEALAAVDLAVEDLAAAEAQADLRRQALARQADLAARGAGSPQAVETAELQVSAADQSVLSRKQALAAARARVDQTAVAVTRAGVALREAERGLAETEIRAGIGGRVDGVALVPGSVVTANEALGTILDPSALEVALRLSTAQYAGLLDAAGRLPPAEIQVALPGLAGAAPLTGTLDRVGPAVGEGQTGRRVHAVLTSAAEAEALLKPGDFVAVTIAGTPLPDAALVPATALGRQGTVLALGPEDRLEEVAVEVLGRQGDAVILRVADLAGREIVTERSVFLGDGIRIRPLRPGTASGPSDPADG